MQQRHQEVNLSLEFMIQLVVQLQRLRLFDASQNNQTRTFSLSQVCSARLNVDVHLTDPVVLGGVNNEDDWNISGEELSLDGPAVKKKVHMCEMGNCGKIYQNNTGLADHHRSVHGAPKLRCEDPACFALFAVRKSHLGHMWVEHGIGAGPKCDECGKRELNLGLLRKHLHTVHGDIKLTDKLQCTEPECRAVYTRKHLRRHMWMEHGIGEGVKCSECGKRATDLWYLADHLRAVHDAPKLRCSKSGCEAAFSRIRSLRNHMKNNHR